MSKRRINLLEVDLVDKKYIQYCIIDRLRDSKQNKYENMV